MLVNKMTARLKSFQLEYWDICLFQSVKFQYNKFQTQCMNVFKALKLEVEEFMMFWMYFLLILLLKNANKKSCTMNGLAFKS